MIQFEWKMHARVDWGMIRKKKSSKRFARYASTMMNSGWLPRMEEPVGAGSRCSMDIETFS